MQIYNQGKKYNQLSKVLFILVYLDFFHSGCYYINKEPLKFLKTNPI